MNCRVLVLLATAVSTLYCRELPAEAPYTASWKRQFGSNSTDQSHAIAIAPAGNIFVAGSTGGSFAGPKIGRGPNAFLTMYDQAGNAVWAKQFGTTAFDGESALALAVDFTGNAYVGGYTGGTLAGVSAGSLDAYLRKYDSEGNILWTQQFGTPGVDILRAAVVDSFGDVLVTGLTHGTLAAPNSGSVDGFLRKYDSSGNVLWTTQFFTSMEEDAVSVAVDASGNAFVVGSAFGANGQPTGETEQQALLRKFDVSGNLVWTRHFGTFLYDDYATDVVVDAAGNAIVLGNTNGSLGDQNPNLDSPDVFLRKYDAEGNEQWTKQFGTTRFDYGGSLSIDPLGNILVFGSTEGNLEGQTVGDFDVYLSKYDATGNRLWIDQFGSPYGEIGRSLVLDQYGNVFGTGYSRGSIAGPNILPNIGGLDVYLVKWAVPEPSTVILLGVGLAGLIAIAKRRCRPSPNGTRSR